MPTTTSATKPEEKPTGSVSSVSGGNAALIGNDREHGATNINGAYHGASQDIYTPSSDYDPYTGNRANNSYVARGTGGQNFSNSGGMAYDTSVWNLANVGRGNWKDFRKNGFTAVDNVALQRYIAANPGAEIDLNKFLMEYRAGDGGFTGFRGRRQFNKMMKQQQQAAQSLQRMNQLSGGSYFNGANEASKAMLPALFTKGNTYARWAENTPEEKEEEPKPITYSWNIAGGSDPKYGLYSDAWSKIFNEALTTDEGRAWFKDRAGTDNTLSYDELNNYMTGLTGNSNPGIPGSVELSDLASKGVISEATANEIAGMKAGTKPGILGGRYTYTPPKPDKTTSTAVQRKGGIMSRRFQAGGPINQQQIAQEKGVQQQQQLIEMFQAIATSPKDTLLALQKQGIQPNQIIDIAQKMADKVPAARQALAALQQMQQMAAKGAKLQYIQRLRNKCPEGFELQAYRAGGQICQRCVRAAKAGMKSETHTAGDEPELVKKFKKGRKCK